MTDAEFQQKWGDISSTLTKHTEKLLTDPKCAKFINDFTATTKTEMLSVYKTVSTLQQWYEWGMKVEQKLEAMNEEIKTGFADVESRAKERHDETQGRLIKVENFQNNTLQLNQEKKEQTVDRTELNRKTEQAKITLLAYQKELEKLNIPSETSMTVEITQRLHEKKILVIQGIPGSGKTHLAKCVLNRFSYLYPTIDPLIICEPNKIEKVLDPNGSFVLLIDDMIGKISFDTTECKDWSRYIDTFLSQVQVGNLYVVITIRKAIFKQCQNEEMSNLFKEDNLIDTDTYFSDEKRTIFEVYRKYHNVVISSDQADQIVQQQYAGIGFPFLCKIMHHAQDVDKLFKRPTEYLNKMISPSKQLKDPTLFVALFMTLVGDNILSRNRVTEDQRECLNKLRDLFELPNMAMYTVYKEADTFEGTFLTFNKNKNMFAFIHEAVAHSTFEVALELPEVPDILIERCPFDSLIENMNLICQTTNAKLNTPNPYKLHQQLIINRMKQVISIEGSTKIKSVTKATIWKERSFTNDALRMFDIEHFRKKDEKDMCVACHFASCGRKYPLEIVVRRILTDDRNKSVKQLQKALAEACLSVENECVDYLIPIVDISQEIVIAAVKGGRINIVEKIIEKYGKDKVYTLREKDTERTILHIAAINGKMDLIKHICITHPDLLHEKEENGKNALHIAAFKGTVECMKYLVDDMRINPDVKTKDEETILHRAALGGNIATMTYICETYSDLISKTDNCRRTALHDAAIHGTVECMQYLVDQGIDPRVKTKDEETILNRSAVGGNISTLKYICETYSDMLHVEDSYGNTALHDAARNGTVECMHYLVDQGIAPEVKTKHEETLLHLSALGGNIATMKYICETHSDMLHVTDIHGNTDLHHAAREGTVECMKYLNDQGINPEVKTKDEETILHRSAVGGNIATMKYICETYSDMLRVEDSYGNTALHDSARNGTVECMQYLVDQGIAPEVKTKNEETLLHSSALGGNIATMKYICETYSDMLHVEDIFGNTALHQAAFKGTVECMKYLVDQGINPEVKTKVEETILHRSALGGNIATMKYICETYSDMLRVGDSYGNTALHDSARNGTVECMQYLVDQGIAPEVKTKNEETLLHLSALGGNIATMKYICETHSDLISKTDNCRRTALHNAAIHGTVECLQYLVDQGMDPRVKTKIEETILHRAAVGGNIATLKYICETYADMLQVTDIHGNTALQDAELYGTVDCRKYLVDQEIDPRVNTKNEETKLHQSAV